MKRGEIIIWVLFGFFAIIAIIIVIYDQINADTEFCKISFNGKIEKIIPADKGNIKVKISNDKIYYLSFREINSFDQIEIDDTLIKRMDCYKVILRKEGADYDISSFPLRTCPCENNNK